METFRNIIEYFALLMGAVMLVSLTNKQLQIFQQSQYRFRSFRKNLKVHYFLASHFWPPYIFFYFYLHLWYIQLIFGIYLGILLFLKLRRKAILKLKYTARIKRLYFVLIVVNTLLASFLAWQLPLPHLASGLILLLFDVPFVVYFSALLIQPLEGLILGIYLKKADRKLRKMAPVVIGITGSYGKTSTKNILFSYLQEDFRPLPSPASFNTLGGLALTVNRHLKNHHDAAILEMGATHKGDIEKLAKFARPKHGIVTAVGPQHLESFKAIDAVVCEKMKLIEALPEDGIAVLNYDDEHIRNYPLKRTGKTVTYGLGEGVDYRAVDVKADLNGISFKIRYKGKESKLHAPLLGEHNIYNILAAFALASELGIPEKELIYRTETLEPVEHRLSLRSEGELLIIDDAYNSNPEGFRSALGVLSLHDGFKILITPGIVEGGREEKKINRALAETTASVCDLVILVRTKASLEIKQGLDACGYGNVKIVDDFRKAMKIVRENHADAVVLIENDITDIYKI